MSTPKQDDGGPAFPFGQVSEPTGQPINGFFAPGMSLRDWWSGGMWLYPQDVIVRMSAEAFDAARKEGA